MKFSDKISDYKPNLFIPGAAKSATSSLHEYLNLHPDIYMSKVKEPHFFSDKFKFENKQSEYYSLYKEGAHLKYRGESSTFYMVFPLAISRIKKTIKNPRFIFILRNPIDRAFSHFSWVSSFGVEKEDFKRAIISQMNEEPDPKPSYSFGERYKGYKYYYQFGLYGKWLENFYNSFEKKSLFIITSEELKSDPLNTVNKCFDFLSIPSLHNIDEIQINKTVKHNNPFRVHKLHNKLSMNKLILVKYIIPQLVNDKLKRIKTEFIHKVDLYSNRIEDPQITKDLRKWLASLYIEDFEKLRKVTSMDFNYWEDFV